MTGTIAQRKQVGEQRCPKDGRQAMLAAIHNRDHGQSDCLVGKHLHLRCLGCDNVWVVEAR